MKKINNGLRNLDKQAYEIVCDWAKAINFNSVRQGVDYSFIIRFYLWDKVGRALRIKHNLSFNEIEVYNKDQNSNPFYYTPLHSKGNYTKPLLSKKKLVYIPYSVGKTELLVDELRKLQNCRVISKQTTKQFHKKDVVKGLNFKVEEQWSLELTAAVFKGLKLLEIDLIPEDIELLKNQIYGTVGLTQLAFKELKKYKPNAVYVYSDNHPPFINYVLVAKYLGIPTFTYQHGLDCERFFLDDCFADYVAVWSNYRKRQYQLNSKFQPIDYKVVGNFFLQPLKKETEYYNKKKTILFITRPHKPIKCYSPSQNHILGLKVLKAILKVLKINKDIKLFIKPHHMDDFEIYKTLIDKRGLADRASITNKYLPNLFEEADIVITEDSTAGAEAMRYYKPCIHAHLAKSEPVLPFVKYGAAFSGRTEKEIIDNLNSALIISKIKMSLMQKEQQKLVDDLIPSGNVKDLVNFIIKNS